MKVLVLFSIFVAISQSAPSSHHVVHQRRNPDIASEWSKVNTERLNRRSILPVSIGLTQRNLDQGDAFILDVSDPQSLNYGRHWTPEKVAETFAPSEVTITGVKSWLIASGISEDRITLSYGRTWLRMNLTVSETERLLKTEYHIFEHATTGKRSIACREYSIPLALRSHIDYITPTVEYTDAFKMAARSTSTTSTKGQHSVNHKKAVGLAPPKNPHAASSSTGLTARDSGINELSWSLAYCGSYVSRACVQKLYNMPNGTLSLSSMAIFNLSPQVFMEVDLETYLYELVTQTGYSLAPSVDVMSDAQFNPAGTDGGWDAAGEGDIDVQFSAGLIYPQPLIFYAIGSIDVFLDAVDASYCNTVPGTVCGGTPLASVISLSWAWPEIAGDPAQTRQCNEFMKLGLLGTTVVAASGDYGVSGGGTDMSCTAFTVLWPAACPYVTSVGGTQIPVTGNYMSREVAWTSTNIQDGNGAGSGGGLSLAVPLPSWQSSAVAGYRSLHLPAYNSSQLPSNYTTRGVPDLSANAYNGLFVVQDQWYVGAGTSFSAPIVGSLITLINNQRLAAGKSTVGFINPVLYAHPSAMNDIISGNNPGCGTNGFSAVTGWDPVTGLGTPDYGRLLTVFLALP